MLVAQRGPVGVVVQGAAMTVPLDDVFVSIDLDDDTAHIACDGGDGIHWKELPRSDGELLVRLGGSAHIQLPADDSDNGDTRPPWASEGGSS